MLNPFHYKERLDQLISVTTVAGCDTFIGNGLPTPWGRLFGGQILGQAVVAAAATVAELFHVHSLHAYFLLAGDSRTKILYYVERIHTGRSFAQRRVSGKQNNRTIFVVTASFQKENNSHQLEFQQPGVEILDLLKYRGIPQWGSAMAGLPSAQELISKGVIPQPDPITGSTISVLVAEGERYMMWWRKHEQRLPDDASWADHAAVVAYITDRGTVGTVKQPYYFNPELNPNGHDLRRGHWGGVSLDHSIHFHRRFRCDEWLFFYQKTDISTAGRGLADIKIFRNNGDLVASCTQEALIRLPRPRL